MTDLLSIYRVAVAAFTDRVRQVGDDQWTLPTPCAEWTVRDLVNHVVNEQRWTVPLFAGATIAEVGDRFDGDLLGSDPVGTAREAAIESVGAVSAPGALERTVRLSFGETPAVEYVEQLVADHLIHGWDLATAIGVDARLDPNVVDHVAVWFADREELYRGGGAIGPRTAVAEDAGAQDRLLAAFGREPA